MVVSCISSSSTNRGHISCFFKTPGGTDMVRTAAIEWYKGVDTEQLLHLIEDAKDRAEYTADAEERQLWRRRLQMMQEELLRRQELLEEVEL
jgi:hypothetical protein